MADKQSFQEAIKTGYTSKGASVKIGRGMLGGEVVEDADVCLPLKTLNRHGLIAGATGTGKTKTLQMISECLSDNSIPVLLMDIKGDLSGMAAPGPNSLHLYAATAGRAVCKLPGGRRYRQAQTGHVHRRSASRIQ